MMILKSYKVMLHPTEEQLPLFWQSAGAARWAYNWALERPQESNKNGDINNISTDSNLCNGSSSSSSSGSSSKPPGKKLYIQPGNKSSGPDRLTALAFIIMGTGAILYLLWQPLSGIIPAPPCPLHEYTGLLCPGCGTSRALKEILKGNLAGAWGYNLMTVLFLPVLIWAALSQIYIIIRGRKPPGLILPAPWPWVLLVAISAYGILRNIPLPVFDYIRP